MAPYMVFSDKALRGLCRLRPQTRDELIQVNGIGEKKAAEIVAYREENGGFSDIAELLRVSGIGEKTFAEIQDEITVGE